MWSPSQAAARRAAKRKPKFYTGINVWAFVSVMLALLFLLLSDTTSHGHQRASVDFPAAQNAVWEPRALREDVMRVVVTRDGNVYFRQTRVRLEDLSNLIRTALQEDAEKKVYLAADQRAKNRDVEVVLDQIRLAGITRVVILTVKPTR